MNSKNQNINNKNLFEDKKATCLLLQKINANVKTDTALKRKPLKGYVSWPQSKK